MGRRRRGREAALRALYQADVLGERGADPLVETIRAGCRDAAAAAFAESLVRGVLERWEEIDARIEAVARNWTLDRMAAVDRTILRISAHEILHRDDVPPAASIDEAVDLVRTYSTAKSGAFVNGILDRILAEREGRAAVAEIPLPPPPGEGASETPTRAPAAKAGA